MFIKLKSYEIRVVLVVERGEVLLFLLSLTFYMLHKKLEIMCYYTTEKERAKIAKQDMIVYKTVIRIKKGIYVAGYKTGYKYTIDQLQPKIKIKKHHFYSLCISEGYHFALNRKGAKEHKKHLSWIRNKGVSVHKFLIPKGTRYFFNDEIGEGVAEQIIMVK